MIIIVIIFLALQMNGVGNQRKLMQVLKRRFAYKDKGNRTARNSLSSSPSCAHGMSESFREAEPAPWAACPGSHLHPASSCSPSAQRPLAGCWTPKPTAEFTRQWEISPRSGMQQSSTGSISSLLSTSPWDTNWHSQFLLSGGLGTIALVGIIVGIIVAVGILAGIIIAVVRKMSGRYS